MPPTLVAVLVITLLLPGLVLLIAVVVRFLLRGAPRPPHRPDDDERFDAQP